MLIPDGINADMDPNAVMRGLADAAIEDSERELRKWCLVFAFQCSPEGVYGDDVMRLAATLERFVNDGHVPSPEKLKAV
jgi:hypothetical protein